MTDRRLAELRAAIGQRKSSAGAQTAHSAHSAKPTFAAPISKLRCPRYPSLRGAKYPCDGDYGHGHMCSDPEGGVYLVTREGEQWQSRRVE